ncbi:MAG TPA: class II aldolase/adducin family protein [Desulfuromonadales bacterium]|nr:class II aldolase/adducin family protein [Desulfuromonadales bacterium]
MAQQEGVIKFQLDYSESKAVQAAEILEINAWRQILFRLRLIGRDSGRYGGYAFGNVSRRMPSAGPRCSFLISGTQTGGLEEIGAEHYASVLDCDIAANSIAASGPIRPSSEALTHAAVYERSETICAVLHAHSPEIWHCASAIGLPMTSSQAVYGTPEMAEEVERLFALTDVGGQKIFAMGGHEDGVVSFGETPEEAGLVLVRYLARALERT